MNAIRCVGGIVYDGAGSLLLIKRANEPSAGFWSLPGGKVEPGECDADAVTRELREETGLEVLPGKLAGTLTRGRYEIYDYACAVHSGTVRPGDDAADARWFDATTLREFAMAGLLTSGLLDTLRSWRALPAG